MQTHLIVIISIRLSPTNSSDVFFKQAKWRKSNQKPYRKPKNAGRDLALSISVATSEGLTSFR